MLDENVFHGRKLCVVGNICRDVKTAPLCPEPRLFADGETHTDFIVETIGGGGANSALIAAGLGAEVAFAGKVGVDTLGDTLEKALIQRGVRSYLRHDPECSTGSSVALSFTNGCRHFVSCQPNNDTLSLADIDLAVLDQGGHLLRADVWFSESMLFDGNARLFSQAHDRGIRVSLDLNWDPLWDFAAKEVIDRRKESVQRLLPQVDLVHGNLRELGIFAGSTDLDAILERLSDWGAKAVVLHMGAQGAGYYHNGRLVVEPCVPVEKQVNTTGTGDLLSTCLMLLDGTPLAIADQLRFANRIVAEFIEGRRLLLPPL